MRSVDLPSGAVLKVTCAPFATSKALYQAILKELRMARGDTITDIGKEIFCLGFSSLEVEACLWECFKRCSYNASAGPGAGADLKIDKDTFELVERREDYFKVCAEVVKENVLPFAKNLYAEFQNYLSMFGTTQA